MSITGRFDLRPYGDPRFPVQLVKFYISSSDDGRHHEYDISYGDNMLEGKIPKTRSGHGNILHLLADILKDIDLDVLGEDYTNVRKKK